MFLGEARDDDDCLLYSSDLVSVVFTVAWYPVIHLSVTLLSPHNLHSGSFTSFQEGLGLDPRMAPGQGLSEEWVTHAYEEGENPAL